MDQTFIAAFARGSATDNDNDRHDSWPGEQIAEEMDQRRREIEHTISLGSE